MSQAAKSLFVFGIYLCGLGLILLLVPNLMLQFFGATTTNEVWIRINGMFVLCLSFYYVQAARKELTIFIRWTVWTRVAVILFFTAFVLLVSAPKALLLFGLIDLSAAIWTWLALKKEEARPPNFPGDLLNKDMRRTRIRLSLYPLLFRLRRRFCRVINAASALALRASPCAARPSDSRSVFRSLARRGGRA